jgi:1,4-Dihydroxy-2-naphthoate synthase (EC 4.1.3.36)
MINRLEKYNACTSVTVYELTEAFIDAWADKDIGVVVFTGAGNKAFCTGGDQSIRDVGGYKGDMDRYQGTIAALPLEVGWQFLTYLIRHIPNPVIARVNGYTIGGGHVWQVNCDLSIASESAQFGQAGPRVGSFDPGFGTGDLRRNVGLKKAKEIWYLCRRYTAKEALDMGLVNRVVPEELLDEEVKRWCEELLEKSPTALKMIKYAFLAELEIFKCRPTHHSANFIIAPARSPSVSSSAFLASSSLTPAFSMTSSMSSLFIYLSLSLPVFQQPDTSLTLLHPLWRLLRL